MAKNGEGEILEWLGAQQGAMLGLLEDLVNIDGGGRCRRRAHSHLS